MSTSIHSFETSELAVAKDRELANSGFQMVSAMHAGMVTKLHYDRFWIRLLE